MGNSSSAEEESTIEASLSRFQLNIDRKFYHVRDLVDERYGSIRLMKCNETNLLLATFCLGISDKNNYTRIVEHLERSYYGSPCHLITRLVHFDIESEDRFIFDKKWKIFIAFEYLSNNLKNELTNLRGQGGFLTQEGLLYLVEAFIELLHELQKRDTAHGSIRPFNILISYEGKVKVLDSLFSILNRKRSMKNLLAEREQFYISPTLFARLKGNSLLNSSTAEQIKFDVFAAGMTLIEAALIVDVSRCYDFTEQKFLPRVIEGWILVIEQIYGSDVARIISMMTALEESLRPGLATLRIELSRLKNLGWIFSDRLVFRIDPIQKLQINAKIEEITKIYANLEKKIIPAAPQIEKTTTADAERFTMSLSDAAFRGPNALAKSPDPRTSDRYSQPKDSFSESNRPARISETSHSSSSHLTRMEDKDNRKSPFSMNNSGILSENEVSQGNKSTTRNKTETSYLYGAEKANAMEWRDYKPSYDGAVANEDIRIEYGERKTEIYPEKRTFSRSEDYNLQKAENAEPKKAKAPVNINENFHQEVLNGAFGGQNNIYAGGISPETTRTQFIEKKQENYIVTTEYAAPFELQNSRNEIRSSVKSQRVEGSQSLPLPSFSNNTLDSLSKPYISGNIPPYKENFSSFKNDGPADSYLANSYWKQYSTPPREPESKGMAASTLGFDLPKGPRGSILKKRNTPKSVGSLKKVTIKDEPEVSKIDDLKSNYYQNQVELLLERVRINTQEFI